MKAIMIPSIDSAIYLKKKLNIYKNFIICTNSPSVYIYCIFYLKINCVDINDFFSDRKKNTKNAAKTVARKSKTEVDLVDANNMIKESDVAKMSDREYEKHAEKIREAHMSGKIIYDVSGNAR